MTDPSLTTITEALRQEQEIEVKLLYAAYDFKPMNLLMTSVTTIILGSILWFLFPSVQIIAWIIAVLASAAVGYVEWVAFQRARPGRDTYTFWQRLFVAQATASGAAWALGPTLLMSQATGAGLALFVSILFSVCAVAMVSVALQRSAMQAFIAAAMLPPAVSVWLAGGNIERILALVLLCGMGSMIIVGRNFNQAMRTLLETKYQMEEAFGRLQKIAGRVPGTIYQFRLRPDGSSCFPFASEAINEIYRVSAEEVRMDASKVFAVLHPDDYDGVGASIQKSAKDLTPWIYEYRVKFDDGMVRWLYGNAIPEREMDGSTLWHGFITDITERKLAEYDLRIAATAFESQEGMLVTDANSVILRVNQAFTDITGYAAEEVIGKNPRIFQSGHQNAEFYAAMWKSIHTAGAWEGEIWNRRKSGEVYPEHLTITAVKDSNGNVCNYVATLTDVTTSRASAEEIRSLAFYDPLTGLPNRRLLLDRLRQALASSARSGREGALLFIDLDDFKSLNDTLGHDIGDLLLQQVAERLAACVRIGDTVARLGGDEYVIVLEELSAQPIEAAAQAEAIGNKILAALSQPYLLATHQYRGGGSVGLALFGDHQQSLEELLKHADIAMYQAKKAGRNALRFFDPQMQDAINARVALEGELRNALEHQQFQLYYQIQMDSSLHPVGAEALIRWLHPERGLVPPFEFITLAEDTGLILPIGLWVLDTACAQLKAWQQDALTRELMLSVNISARQFRQAEFVAQVQAVVQRHAINPTQLKLELTESLLLENIEDTVATMTALKELGVRFSLDDFGTGYSSLQYLKQLPLSQLKIDQSFVHDISVNSSDKAIVRTIIAMAHSLELEVIAEGVETEEQRQLLINKGCTHFQGYLFSKPVPIAQFEALLKRG